MRISELIAKLQEAMAEHGDLPAHVLVADGCGASWAEPDIVVEKVEPGAYGLSYDGPGGIVLLT